MLASVKNAATYFLKCMTNLFHEWRKELSNTFSSFILTRGERGELTLGELEPCDVLVGD